MRSCLLLPEASALAGQVYTFQQLCSLTLIKMLRSWQLLETSPPWLIEPILLLRRELYLILFGHRKLLVRGSLDLNLENECFVNHEILF